MKTYSSNGKRLIYTQIDIPIDLPDTEDMKDFHFTHGVVNKDYEDIIQNRHDYTVACSRYDIDNWRILPTAKYMDKRHWKIESTEYKLNWNPDFAKRFPALVSAILSAPFKEIAFAGWMRQIGPYPAHTDSIDPRMPMEPRRYNILLTNPKHNTFWMGTDDNKIYPIVDSNYPMFCFNNNDTTHGTNPITDFKLMMGIVGIIDDIKHEKLVYDSVTKYPEKALWL